jgi:hypothetical protein
MAVNWLTVLATILGGTISGVIGILVSNYSTWHENKLVEKDWYRQIGQQIQHVVILAEQKEDGDQATVGELARVAGTMTQELNSLESELLTFRTRAPPSVEAQTLKLIVNARTECVDICSEDNPSSEKVIREDNDLHKLKRTVTKKKEYILTNFISYVLYLIM